jgi:hypothetical protein
MESIDDVINKKMSKSLFKFKGLVDPENKHGFDTPLIEAWNALSLSDQRKLYLYLLYRKWRGIDIYGEPYYIIKNCHPVPLDWNGHIGINSLAKQGKLVIAKYNGSYGTYTRDEAKIYEMTDVKPLN